MTVNLRALVIALAGTLLTLALIASVAPAKASPQGNGNAKIAGSQCDRAFQRIVASGVVQQTGNKEAFFTCSAGSIVIDVKSSDKKKSDQLLLGNVQTLQTRSIKGAGRAQRDRAADELGVGDSRPQARAGVPSNTCLPSQSTGTYVDNSTHAHGNVDMCYGRFIYRGLVAVEIVWSDTLSYVMRQQLDARVIQHFSLANTSTNQAYEIGVEIQWNQRKTEFGSDPFISGPDIVGMLPFDVGDIQTEEYFPSQSEGTLT